ncbi:hypothetical protein R1sor_002606 [Riccia sorocarpa]|uniref:Uncharacterized protein n=1 Tax=Riccia sorocarpa TaxID=122646 RepID=A0ABD3H200_9MARC
MPSSPWCQFESFSIAPRTLDLSFWSHARPTTFVIRSNTLSFWMNVMISRVTREEVRQEWEKKVGLQKQQDAFNECIKALYQKTPHVLSERRIIEAEKRQCFNVKYTDTGVERTWRVSAATTKVKSASPCSTVVSTREEERENDVSLVRTNHVPRTRSRAGKRVGSKGEVVRKVRTRSYVTKAEISTGIGSPRPYTRILLRPLREIETPEAMKRTGAFSSCERMKRKIII